MANWTFLTHHGHVLVAVSQSADLTVDQISEIVSYAAQLIVEYRSQRNLDYIDELYESLVDAEILSST